MPPSVFTCPIEIFLHYYVADPGVIRSVIPQPGTIRIAAYFFVILTFPPTSFKAGRPCIKDDLAN